MLHCATPYAARARAPLRPAAGGASPSRPAPAPVPGAQFICCWEKFASRARRQPGRAGPHRRSRGGPPVPAAVRARHAISASVPSRRNDWGRGGFASLFFRYLGMYIYIYKYTALHCTALHCTALHCSGRRSECRGRRSGSPGRRENPPGLHRGRRSGRWWPLVGMRTREAVAAGRGRRGATPAAAC